MAYWGCAPNHGKVTTLTTKNDRVYYIEEIALRLERALDRTELRELMKRTQYNEAALKTLAGKLVGKSKALKESIDDLRAHNDGEDVADDIQVVVETLREYVIFANESEHHACLQAGTRVRNLIMDSRRYRDRGVSRRTAQFAGQSV